MYLNFSNFRGRTSAGGGTSLGPKTGTSVGWGGLVKFSPDGGTPQSPPRKKPWAPWVLTNFLTVTYTQKIGKNPYSVRCDKMNILKGGVWQKIAERMRNPFSYGIRHVFIVSHWNVTHSSLNHNENMLYPVWKSCHTGFRILSNIWLSTAQLQHYFKFSGACFGCPSWIDNQNFKHRLYIRPSSIANPICQEGQSERTFLIFPLFPNFSLFFLILGKIFAVKGAF